MRNKNVWINLLLIGAAIGACNRTANISVDPIPPSPVIKAYGEAVRVDYEKEWGGLTPEEIKIKEDCLSGFSDGPECRRVP